MSAPPAPLLRLCYEDVDPLLSALGSADGTIAFAQLSSYSLSVTVTSSSSPAGGRANHVAVAPPALGSLWGLTPCFAATYALDLVSSTAAFTPNVATLLASSYDFEDAAWGGAGVNVTLAVSIADSFAGLAPLPPPPTALLSVRLLDGPEPIGVAFLATLVSVPGFAASLGPLLGNLTAANFSAAVSNTTLVLDDAGITAPFGLTAVAKASTGVLLLAWQDAPPNASSLPLVCAWPAPRSPLLALAGGVCAPHFAWLPLQPATRVTLTPALFATMGLGVPPARTGAAARREDEDDRRALPPAGRLHQSGGRDPGNGQGCAATGRDL
jgi:hypothetical protein